tara:strand:+ start:3771 stop:4844 length:1074 start_codon:yes stop_codon:yes gene_type:complete
MNEERNIKEILEAREYELGKLSQKTTKAKKNTVQEINGAGEDYALTSSFTSAEAPPLSMLLLNSTLTGNRYDKDNVKEIVKVINDKIYKTTTTNSFKYGHESFLLLHLLNHINNESLKSQEDISHFTMTFEELDNLHFIKKKNFRKRFNIDEMVTVNGPEGIRSQLHRHKIDQYEACEKVYDIKRVNDSIYEAFAIKAKRMEVNSLVYNTDNSFSHSIECSLFNEVIVNHENQDITFEVGSRLANTYRSVKYTRFPSITFMGRLSEIETGLYLLLESFSNQEHFIYMDDFVKRTGFTRTIKNKATGKVEDSPKKLRYELNKAFGKLQELGYIDYHRKSEIKKNGSTIFRFKKNSSFR